MALRPIDITRPSRKIANLARPFPIPTGTALDFITISGMIDAVNRAVLIADLPELKGSSRISHNRELDRILKSNRKALSRPSFSADTPKGELSRIIEEHTVIPFRRTAHQVLSDGWVSAIFPCTDKNHVLLSMLRAKGFRARFARHIFPELRRTTSRVEVRVRKKWYEVNVLGNTVTPLSNAESQRAPRTLVFRGKDSHDAGFRSYADVRPYFDPKPSSRAPARGEV